MAIRNLKNKLYKIVTSKSQLPRYSLQKCLLTIQSTFYTIPHLCLKTTTTELIFFNKIQVWHKHIGHLNYKSLYHLSNWILVNSVPKISNIKHTCLSWVMDKHYIEYILKKKHVTNNLTSPNDPLQLVQIIQNLIVKKCIIYFNLHWWFQ